MQRPLVEADSWVSPEQLCAEYPDTVTLTGLANCIMGVIERVGMEQPVLLYSHEMILEELQDDMSEEEAMEWFEYNILGAWMGDGTPAFLLTLDS